MFEAQKLTLNINKDGALQYTILTTYVQLNYCYKD